MKCRGDAPRWPHCAAPAPADLPGRSTPASSGQQLVCDPAISFTSSPLPPAVAVFANNPKVTPGTVRRVAAQLCCAGRQPCTPSANDCAAVLLNHGCLRDAVFEHFPRVLWFSRRMPFTSDDVTWSRAINGAKAIREAIRGALPRPPLDLFLISNGPSWITHKRGHAQKIQDAAIRPPTTRTNALLSGENLELHSCRRTLRALRLSRGHLANKEGGKGATCALLWSQLLRPDRAWAEGSSGPQSPLAKCEAAAG